MLLGVRAPIVKLHVDWGLESFGKPDAHNVVGEWHFIVIFWVLVPIKVVLIQASPSGKVRVSVVTMPAGMFTLGLSMMSAVLLPRLISIRGLALHYGGIVDDDGVYHDLDLDGLSNVDMMTTLVLNFPHLL